MGYKEAALKKHIEGNTTFEQFFQRAKLNPKAHLVTGAICGYRVEDIENPRSTTHLSEIQMYENTDLAREGRAR